MLYPIDLSNIYGVCEKKLVHKSAMGENLKFQEKSQDYCLKGENWDMELDDSEKIKCGLLDFRCGFKFERNGQECVEMKEARTKMEYDNGKGKDPKNLHYDICWCSEGICHQTQKIRTKKYQKIPGNQCFGEIENNPELTFDLTCEMEDGYNKYIHFGKDSDQDEILNKNGEVEKSETSSGSSLGMIFILLMLTACACGAYFYYRGRRLPGALARFSRYHDIDRNDHIEVHDGM